MRRSISILLILSFVFVGLVGCSGNFKESVLDLERKGAFKYLWEQANSNKGSDGYGLVRDRYPQNSEIASIATTGFALTAIPIGVENKWISRKEGYERVLGTLKTLEKLEHERGFFYHFVNMETGKREWDCEVSNIDTAILINGALFAGQYFGGEIEERAKGLYERIDWNWFIDDDNNMFYMSYTPEEGFAGHWDFYGEQLMLYVLAAGSPTHPMDKDVYYSFKRRGGRYGDGEFFINSWFGSIFTYQFSHAWIDFRDRVDEKNTDWFENSVRASRANYEFCMDNEDGYKTFDGKAWGLSACDTPTGYRGLGAPPSGTDDNQHIVDGTIPPAGAAGSIVFLPDETIEALNHYYTEFPELWGEYGFKGAYNLDYKDGWFDEDYVGIDKGITLLMIQNYEDEFVWNIFMDIDYIETGLERLGFTSKD